MTIDEILKKNYNLSVNDVLNIVSKESGYGNITNNYQQILRGTNHRGLGNPMSKAMENVGITLFTRPNLNLTYDNIKLVRQLTNLITRDSKTYQYYVRALLDPTSNKGLAGEGEEHLDSPLVDSKSPFMPILTNTLLSTSGWPDIAVDTTTTSEGVYNENMSMVDGNYKINTNWTLSTVHRNIEGDPVTMMIFSWIVYYVSLRLEKDFVPYPRSVVNNRRDYYSGVYHLVLDPTKQFVTKIAKTMIYPKGIDIGSNFNYQGADNMVSGNEQISIQWSAEGAEYMDPITIEEFNTLAAVYDNRMIITAIQPSGLKLKGDSSLIALKPGELKEGNYYGRPLIHPFTGKLTWYVDEFEYNEIKRAL